LQSRKFGSIGYLIGALNSAWHANEGDSKAWYEQDASIRGIDYFRNKVNNIESYGEDDWTYNATRKGRNYSWMTGIFMSPVWLINELLKP
jgi:hypothetical protein